MVKKSKKSIADSKATATVELGTIISVRGADICIVVHESLVGQKDMKIRQGKEEFEIGQPGSILKVIRENSILYALVTGLRRSDQGEKTEVLMDAVLFGENHEETEASYTQGISQPPPLLAPVYPIPGAELEALLKIEDSAALEIGNYRDANKTPCGVDINELLTRPTAVVGSTGSGKSGTVAALLHSILGYSDDVRLPAWKPRILLLDPHGEYARAFPDGMHLSNKSESFILPYWIFDLREFTNLLVDPDSETAVEEADILRKAIVRARVEAAMHFGYDTDLVTADSPIPFRLGSSGGSNIFGRLPGNVLYEHGLIGKINLERPVDTERTNHYCHNKLIQKIELLKLDSRMAFLMQEPEENVNPLPDILSVLMSEQAQPLILDLSGMPGEIAGVLSAALARVIFNLRVWQTAEERERSPILLVCEEAHRYIPSDDNVLYRSAQLAIRQIAKEGRKYGLGLVVISQRPSELDVTVLSQCSNWFILRIQSDSDARHLGSLFNSFSSLTSILPSLRPQEALFVGLASRLPAVVRVRDLEADKLPASQNVDFVSGWQNTEFPKLLIENVIERWIHQGQFNVSPLTKAPGEHIRELPEQEPEPSPEDRKQEAIRIMSRKREQLATRRKEMLQGRESPVPQSADASEPAPSDAAEPAEGAADPQGDETKPKKSWLGL